MTNQFIKQPTFGNNEAIERSNYFIKQMRIKCRVKNEMKRCEFSHAPMTSF